MERMHRVWGLGFPEIWGAILGGPHIDYSN